MRLEVALRGAVREGSLAAAPDDLQVAARARLGEVAAHLERQAVVGLEGSGLLVGLGSELLKGHAGFRIGHVRTLPPRPHRRDESGFRFRQSTRPRPVGRQRLPSRSVSQLPSEAQPPSTLSVTPFTNGLAAASLRYRMARAMSSGLANRPIGTRPSMSASV